MWKDLASHPITTSFQTSRKTPLTSKFLWSKERFQICGVALNLTKTGGRRTFRGRGGRGMENRGMNELASASGALVAPQAVRVAIDLVSEQSPHPPPSPHPSSCCQTYRLHLCAVNQSMSRSWLTAVYQLRAALISSIDFNPN